MPFLSKIRLNGTLYDLKVAGDAMVTGVKGDAESDYRVGDVNITPENVGTISTEKTQSLTDTQKSTARDNLGLGSAATRSVPASGNANATQVVLGSDTRLTGSYKTDDSASTTINDTDYIPMSDSSGTKKKTLWSTIVAKVKAALGIASSGSTYLKKDGTWGTPTNTTYTFATGDNNGQIKVTPSGGSAQNVSVKGLGSAAYDSTVPISHGGTGATTRLGAAKNLTNENVTSPQCVVGLTNGHANFGYTTLANLKTAMGTFPPSSHASTGTGYGAGNASNYGHVKLSDEFKSNVGAAANSIGASQNAVYSLGTWHRYAGYVVLSIQNVNSSVNIEGKGYGANAMLYAHASFNSHLVHLKFSMNVKAKISHNTRLFTLMLTQYVYNDNNYSKILYAQNIESVIGQIEFRNTGMSSVNSFDVYSAGGVNAGDYINVEATFIRAPKFSSDGS